MHMQILEQERRGEGRGRWKGVSHLRHTDRWWFWIWFKDGSIEIRDFHISFYVVIWAYAEKSNNCMVFRGQPQISTLKLTRFCRISNSMVQDCMFWAGPRTGNNPLRAQPPGERHDNININVTVMLISILICCHIVCRGCESKEWGQSSLHPAINNRKYPRFSRNARPKPSL